ncbi:hypothetical protein HK103_003818 [Boothiomyces macroporosus]|uniref:Uncharacterized protein n=1 Tax=Boothiomyces macroporosus TaxID=261099 RepID=A0AAD5UM74_9FUNG|nr:hypothetical protein HK103_003818 [Boothiomyces macroporosus]
MENITIKDKTFGGIGVKEWLTKFERLTTLEIHKALLQRLSSKTALETINYQIKSYRCLQLFISIDNPDMQEEISEHKDYSKAMETNDWTTMRNILINLYKKFIRKYSRDDLEKVIREGFTSDGISEYTKTFNKVLENISEREKPNTFQSISDYLRGLGTLATKILNELKTEDLDEEGYPINLRIVQTKAKSFYKTSALLQKFEQIAPINSTSETANTKTDAAIDKLTSAMENMSLLVMKSFAQEQNKSIKTCPICDVAGHRKSVCEKFNQLLNAKYVKKNQQGLATWPDGSVIPVNYGKGGIYKLVMDKLDNHHPVNSSDIETDPIAEIQPTNSCGIVYDEGPLLSKAEVNMSDLLCENGEEEAAHSLYNAFAAQRRKGEETPTTTPTKKNRPWLENIEPQIAPGRTRFDYKFPNLQQRIQWIERYHFWQQSWM